MNSERRSEWWQAFAAGDAPMARRRFLRGAAGAAGAAVAAGLWPSVPLRAGGDGPVTPASYTQLLTFNKNTGSADGADASTILNFKGLIADAVITGTGTGFGKTKNGKEISKKFYFHTDQRIMIGDFVDKNGVTRHGSFALF